MSIPIHRNTIYSIRCINPFCIGIFNLHMIKIRAVISKTHCLLLFPGKFCYMSSGGTKISFITRRRMLKISLNLQRSPTHAATRTHRKCLLTRISGVGIKISLDLHIILLISHNKIRSVSRILCQFKISSTNKLSFINTQVSDNFYISLCV